MLGKTVTPLSGTSGIFATSIMLVIFITARRSFDMSILYELPSILSVGS